VTETRNNAVYRCRNVFCISLEVKDNPSELQHRDVKSVLVRKYSEYSHLSTTIAMFPYRFISYRYYGVLNTE
jgi:hypothetical protein